VSMFAVQVVTRARMLTPLRSENFTNSKYDVMVMVDGDAGIAL